MKKLPLIIVCTIMLSACSKHNKYVATNEPLKPIVVTEEVPYDTDDPCIWINKADTSQSLVIGVDKNKDGGLYVYDLNGKIDTNKTFKLQRPNNVDLAYGLKWKDSIIDIAVASERMTGKIRVFSLPDLIPVDGGGIPVFVGEQNDLMGLALYTNLETGEIYAITGRKEGPNDDYLGQYLLTADSAGVIHGDLVRKFGKFSGKHEIEAIVVDNELGYIYYSDETFGIRKYYADPAKGKEELALFATEGFTEDHEGISIYKTSPTTGYLLISDQEVHQFQIFPREGTDKNPHEHELLSVIKVSATHSDGNDIVSCRIDERFPKGLWVVMSDDKTYHYYSWEQVEPLIISKK